MKASYAAHALQDIATPERAGARTAARLAEVGALFTADLAWIEGEIAEATGDGPRSATDAARHLFSGGGKRIRPLAVLLTAACFGPVPEQARALAVVAELVHLATLLHDDVVDDAPERRGKPTARLVWGNAVSVLAGDLLLTHALERTHAAAPALMSDLIATLRRLVDGEIVQLRGRVQLDVREETYFTIVRDKTASLFGWAARAGATVAGAEPAQIAALGEFGERLGTAFQLVDDLLDYEGDPRVTGKALHADLGEGKVTLPLLRAVGNDPSLSRAVELARQGDADASERLASAVTAPIRDAVRARARDEAARGIAGLARLRESPAKSLLAGLARDLTERSA